ncbi:hypothetical protein [Pseudorhodoferax soli]|uniref:Uncharacterized protein n=1 Tax=Pseudorhodoferax soli TaxID=545864 RepID=A0A368Y5P9_9BURK|nr:hypothetical protein [Pseudorhodoferax soli]RCW75603.1 hypothetical protein DES41_101197 [Pseudorhodoferax soli]
MLHPARSTVLPLKAVAVPRWKRSHHDTLDDSLQRLTMAWMKALPESVRPHQCARRHPRVLNNIAALWGLPLRCLDYLDELQADQRGHRQGFGHEIALELRRLRTRRVALVAAARQSPPPDFPVTQPMAL